MKLLKAECQTREVWGPKCDQLLRERARFAFKVAGVAAVGVVVIATAIAISK